MAKPKLYESRLMAALLLRGGEAHESELAGLFDRPEYLHQATEGLALCGAVVVDRQQSRLRLLRGRALELLGLARVAGSQNEMFSEECLLPVSDGVAPPVKVAVAHATPAVAGATPPTHTRDVLEFSKLVPRDLGALENQTRLSGPARARFEQGATERAQTVAAWYRSDGYLADKLDARRRLKEELMEGRTPTARKFAVLYATKPDRARELLGLAVLANNPPANLNVRLQGEGVRY